MPGSTNFLRWNPNKTNQLDDTDYNSNTLRSGGAPNGALCPSNMDNKYRYQQAIFTAAFAQMLANKGYVVSDADFNALVAVLNDVVTVPELPAPPVYYVADNEILGLSLSSYPTAWTTWDISASIPTGYTKAIIGFALSVAGPMNPGNVHLELWCRPYGSSGAGQLVNIARSYGPYTDSASMNQCIVPVGSSRKIQYKFVNLWNTMGASFKLQGYIK